MTRLPRVRTLAKWAAAGGAVAALSLPFVAAHATTAPPPTMGFRLVSSIAGMALQSSIDNKDGSFTARWSAPTGEQVTITGRPGATVSISSTAGTGPGDMTIQVDPAPLDKRDARRSRRR